MPPHTEPIKMATLQVLETQENLPPENGDGSTSPQIPPTSSPQVPATDPALVKLMQDTIAEQNRRIANYERDLADARSISAPTTPTKTKDELRQEFYDDPITANRRLIREELEATVGPLQEFVKTFKGQTQTDRLIEQFKNDTRFSSHWTPAVERYVREQASRIDPAHLTEQSFGFLVVSAIGMKNVGMFGDSPTPAPQPPTQPQVPTPPYMRPSAPPAPDNTPKQKHRALTEDEKRILREYNSTKSPERRMTEAQFIEWQGMPSADVAFSDFDKLKGGK